MPRTAATIPTPGSASEIISIALIDLPASASLLVSSALSMPPISAGLHLPSTIGRKELHKNSTKPASLRKDGYLVKIELFCGSLTCSSNAGVPFLLPSINNS